MSDEAQNKKNDVDKIIERVSNPISDIPDALKKRMIANTKPFIFVCRCDDAEGSIPPAAASASSLETTLDDVLSTVDA
jgi:hypothetical protein